MFLVQNVSRHFHLSQNILIQVLFGVPLEHTYGALNAAIIYLVRAICFDNILSRSLERKHPEKFTKLFEAPS